MERVPKRILALALSMIMAGSVLFNMVVFAGSSANGTGVFGGAEKGMASGIGTNFTDMKKSHWAYEAVAELASAGIVSGYPDGTFRPGNEVTYGEFLKLVYTACSGRNVQNAADGVYWAENYYYAAASEGYFNQEDIDAAFLKEAIPRKHMAHIASSVIEPAGEGANEKKQELPELFTDITATGEYSYDIMKACGSGILTGYTDGSFGPDRTLTRAEAAVVVLRLCDYMEGRKDMAEEEGEETTEEELTDDFGAGGTADYREGKNTGETIVRKSETPAGIVPVSYDVIECSMHDMGIEKLEYANDGTLRIYSSREYPFVFLMLGDGTILNPIGFPGGFSVREGDCFVFVADTGGRLPEGESVYFMFEDGDVIYRFPDAEI